MKCLVCGDEFEGRADAKYCSDKCRMRLKRTGGVDVVRDTEELGEDVRVNPVRDKLRAKDVPFVDIVKDLKLDPQKDLGIHYWTKDGIFIRPDITVDQVQNIARLIHAKHGRSCPVFNEARL